MKKNRQQPFTVQDLFFVFFITMITVASTLTYAAPLQMPASATSGTTKSLSVQLEANESTNYTLLGSVPTPSKDKDIIENPIVKARSITLAKSKPAASPSTSQLLVGPTLRIRPGDRLDIQFNNNLQYQYQEFHGDNIDSTTIPHGFDVINLHTHGLHVSPQSRSDNVLLNIFPNDTPSNSPSNSPNPMQDCINEFGNANCVKGKYSYKYKIPANHPSGTYWYHAHKHGAVAMHLANGMAGALIIEDPVHGLESLPAVHKARNREQIIFLQQISYGYDTNHTGSGTQENPYLIDCMSVYQGMCDTHGKKNEQPTPKVINRHLSVNGQFQPTISMFTNEAQLWRVINGTTSSIVPMCLVPIGDDNDSSSTETPKVYVLAADGIPIQNPQAAPTDLPVLLTNSAAKPTDGKSLLNNELLLLAAGQRLDLMVKAPSKPGVYALYNSLFHLANKTIDISAKELCQPSSYTNLTPILTVNVEANTNEIANEYNTEIPTQQALNKLNAPATITEAESPKLPTQGVVFGFTKNAFAPEIGGASVINARVFNPIRSQRNLALNQVDLWSVQSANGKHMFHIHINSFQLVSRGVQNGTIQGQINYPFPIWRDTLLVEKQPDLEYGEIVQFLQKPLDFTGSLVMHCHNVFHEDNGMMELVNILPASTNRQSVPKKNAQ